MIIVYVFNKVVHWLDAIRGASFSFTDILVEISLLSQSSLILGRSSSTERRWVDLCDAEHLCAVSWCEIYKGCP
jgi:hypothetical protein